MLSIIIPAYNAQSTIARAVCSALSIPDCELEVIVVNDGSKDSTAHIAKGLAREDSRVVYVEQENQGRSRARNNGYFASKGEWVMFLDSDDYLIERATTEIAAAIKADKSLAIFPMIQSKRDGLVGYSPTVPFEGKKRVAADKTLTVLEYMRILYGSKGSLCEETEHNLGLIEPSACWARLYKREAIDAMVSILGSEKAPFTPGIKFSEDQLFNLAYLACVKDGGILVSGCPLYFWDLDCSQTVSLCKPDDVNNMIPYLDQLDVLKSKDMVSESEYKRLASLELLSQFRRSCDVEASSRQAMMSNWEAALTDCRVKSILARPSLASAKSQALWTVPLRFLHHENYCMAFKCGRIAEGFRKKIRR